MARFGLTREVRVRRSSDFRWIQGRGRRVHGPNVALAYARNREGKTRVGITVSAKQGNAVERNRFKRLVREVFRTTRDAWPPGNDYVVIARNLAPLRSYREMEIELARVVQKVEREGMRS